MEENKNEDLLVIVNIPCRAGQYPLISSQVHLVGDTKQYIYSITNNLDSGETIRIFSLWMPKSGATFVTSFTCSEPNWHSDLSTRYDVGVWSIGSSLGVNAGEQATFTLTTPSSVPTTFTYYSPSNWKWETYSQYEFGNSILPVPGEVPEPSCLAALGFALAGLVARKWKK